MSLLDRIKHDSQLALDGDETAYARLEETYAGLCGTDAHVERGWAVDGLIRSRGMLASMDQATLDLVLQAQMHLEFEDDPDLWVRLRCMSTTMFIEFGEWFSALPLAMSVARLEGDERVESSLVAMMLSTVGWLLIQLARFDEALPYIERALTHGGHPRRLVDTYSDLLEATLGLGDLDEARALLREMRDALGTARYENPRVRAKATMIESLVLSALGEHDEVLAMLELEDVRDYLLTDEQAVLDFGLARSLHARERHECAYERAWGAICAIRHQPLVFLRAELFHLCAYAKTALGEHEAILGLMVELDRQQRQSHTESLGTNLMRVIERMEAEVHQLRHVELEESNREHQRLNAQLQREVRARISAEARMRRAATLEAVGKLAAGLAHDLNNLLMVIYSCVGLLEEDLEGDSLELVADIGTTAERASRLVRRLMSLSNQSTGASTRFELSEFTRQMRSLLRHVVREDVSLTLDAQDDLVVETSRTDLEQVLLNLVINAHEALGERGSIRVTMSRAGEEDELARIVVCDDGSGIPPDVLPHIFEPFFSTKRRQHGSGLGLSICAQAIRRMQGTIECHSVEGEGTTFEITLPLASRLCDGQSADGDDDPLRGATMRVLVVEDDAAVRDSVVRMLTSRGHDVKAACDGMDGLDVFDRSHEVFDLVLSDIVMPNMDGIELAQALLGNSEVPVLLMSGYTDDGGLETLLENPRVALLPKPFSLSQLNHAMRDLVRTTGQHQVVRPLGP